LIVYFDTSALVKVYVEESDSRQMRIMAENAEDVATSVVTYAELRAALTRKLRFGSINESILSAVKREFNLAWPGLRRLAADDVTMKRAGDLAEIHNLRGFDAVHLASAEMLQRAMGSVTFACFDAQLVRAATSCGLAPLPND
jgi:predicted nucleic acid-binding protein